MKFGITPIKLTISKDEYSLSVLGFLYGGNGETHRSTGFILSKWEEEDRSTWYLTLHFYWFIKKMAVKAILDDYYITCNHCGNPVWKHNLYCRHCREEMYSNEVTVIYCDAEKYKEEILQMKKAGYNCEAEQPNKRKR